MGSYTISAEATIAPNELNTDNNKFVDGSIHVILPSAINANGAVDDEDSVLLTEAYGSTPMSPNWNSEADLNRDDLEDASDVHALAENYGKTT